MSILPVSCFTGGDSAGENVLAGPWPSDILKAREFLGKLKESMLWVNFCRPFRIREFSMKDTLDIRTVIRKVKLMFRDRRYWKWLIKSEFAKKSTVSFWMRLSMWRKGFHGRSFLIYSFEKNTPEHYVSDFVRAIRTPFINEPFSHILDNKLVFRDVLKSHQSLVPEYFALIRRGNIQPLVSDPFIRSASYVMDLLVKCREMVLKPLLGGGGEGISIMQYHANHIFLNGGETSYEDFQNLFWANRYMVIMEFIQQAEYARRIFGEATNTVRLLTMWDYDKRAPFIAIAVHRFGSKVTKPVDNFIRGGMSAEIDLQTGKIKQAARLQCSGSVEWRSTHPDTGEKIEGKVVHNWPLIVSEVLNIASTVPHIPYIGWDVVVTNEAFKILEGNNFSSVDLLQVHRPLLRDDRIRRFYQFHKVIR